MPDDARARGIAALDAAYSCAPIDDPNAVQVGGGHVVVTYEQAVDALLAAGWAPPPAPASDDVKARATSAVRIAWATEGGAYDSDELRIAIAVDALADAGLLRGPETSSAAPEGAALSASGTVRRAGGPDHGTAPVGDAVPDASAITFAAWVAAMVGGLCIARTCRCGRLRGRTKETPHA